MRKISKAMRTRVACLAFFSLSSLVLTQSPVHGVQSKTVNVLAASSLQPSYSLLAKNFERANPGVKINISFGSSAMLSSQIIAGAPFDIFVSADSASMAAAKSEISRRSDYVANSVVLAVPLDSSITKVSDLNQNFEWIQCANTVPCGIAANRALASEGGITRAPVSLEVSASSTLAKLISGAVDAAIIYETDVIANQSKIRSISFADARAASTQYQIGISKVAMAKNKRWANAFFLHLQSAEVKKILAKAGFRVNLVK
jgi:molybdate transport system substrate-binding protein